MNAKTLFGILAITVAWAAAGRSQTCAPVTAGLVDWWPGNGDAHDIVGGNNATIPFSDVTFDAGEAGLAFKFNGGTANNDTGNEVDFGTNVGNFGTNDFTVDFWIKQPPTATGEYGILDKRADCSGSGAYWDVRIGHTWVAPSSTSGQLFMDFNDVSGSAFVNVVAHEQINDGNFHHAAFVRHGLNVSIYIDGALDTSVTGPRMANIANSSMFRAGQGVCVGTDGTEPFVGELDELDLFNRALSPAEIQAIYQAGSAGKCGMPSIITEPRPLLVNAHDTASFSVTASLAENYQWSLNGTNINGATSSVLTITNVTQADLGEYAVVLSSGFGATNSSQASLSMYPFLVMPFAGLDTFWGQTNTLSVGAWGTGPLSYQWYDNGVALANATNAMLTLTAIQFSNAGLYSVIVSSPLGSVTNTPYQVVVNPADVSLHLCPNVVITGTVGYSYIIQSTTNLANTNSWMTETSLTLAQPVQYWDDTNTDVTQPNNPHKFYRVLPGP